MKKILTVLMFMLLCLSMAYAADGDGEMTLNQNSTTEGGEGDPASVVDPDEGDDARDPDGDDEGSEEGSSDDETDDDETDDEDTEDDSSDDADGSDELTDDDEEEVDDFDTGYGATMRLLQLEKAITRNVMVGDIVVGIIEENHPDNDTTELLLILADMEDLLEEVQAMDAEGEPEELAQEFVAVKKASINLTHQFRMEAKDILTEEDRQEIRDQVKDINLSAMNKQIREARQMHNAYRLEMMLRAMGIQDEELIQEVQDGDATVGEVVRSVRQSFRALEPKEKLQAMKNARDHAVERMKQKRQVYEAVKDELPGKVKERVRERTANRLDRSSDRAALRSEAAERRAEMLSDQGMEEMAKRMHNVSERLENRAERRDTLSDKLRRD